MSQDLYSVDQVAERLGLHVRTVRNYVRDGRLKAVRIGKQYRIAKDDLNALTAGEPLPAPARETARRTRHADVSCVVQIDAIDRDGASRIANGLTGAANSRRGGPPLRVDAIYDEERARLKIILTGDLAATSGLLQLVSLYMES